MVYGDIFGLLVVGEFADWFGGRLGHGGGGGFGEGTPEEEEFLFKLGEEEGVFMEARKKLVYANQRSGNYILRWGIIARAQRRRG